MKPEHFYRLEKELSFQLEGLYNALQKRDNLESLYLGTDILGTISYLRYLMFKFSDEALVFDVKTTRAFLELFNKTSVEVRSILSTIKVCLSEKQER